MPSVTVEESDEIGLGKVEMATIEMCDLVKSYGNDRVVNGVDLDIKDGQFVVLLGPSGCGKTTTLRMVAGLEQITEGELRFDGRLMNDVPPDKRGVGMVFQQYALYPHMTVSKNLSFGLESRRERGSRRKVRLAERERVLEIARMLELEHVLDHRPKELSGGQRQRVALGRALIRDPEVFLLDEPLSNLDANLRDRMRMELARLHEDLPVTSIFVTHDQGEALTLADCLVVMHEGKIRQAAAPSEVYDFPADTFVAGFLGSPGMNLWKFDVNQDKRYRQGVLLPEEVVLGLANDLPQVIVGIRPEHLEIVGERHPALAVLECRIHMVEHLGSHQLVHATLRGNEAESVVAQLDPKDGPLRGETILLGASAEHLHLFDPGTGKRLQDCEARQLIKVLA